MLMTYMYGRLVLSVRSAENLQRFLCSDVEAGRLDYSFFFSRKQYCIDRIFATCFSIFNDK